MILLALTIGKLVFSVMLN